MLLIPQEVYSLKILGTHVDMECLYRFCLHQISLGNFSLEVHSRILPNAGTTYNGVLRPKLSYGLVFCGACAKNKFLRTFGLQNKAIRIIENFIPKAFHTVEEFFRENLEITILKTDLLLTKSKLGQFYSR